MAFKTNPLKLEMFSLHCETECCLLGQDIFALITWIQAGCKTKVAAGKLGGMLGGWSDVGASSSDSARRAFFLGPAKCIVPANNGFGQGRAPS